ncbi:MAG: type II secretion system F family protein [Anaerolineae bacterium]|nr:type II secretion system F family protein [Anaerolineae bacterium]
MLIGAQLLLSLIIGLSVLAFIMGARAWLVPQGTFEDRLQNILEIQPGESLRNLEMQASFSERMIRPLGANLLNWLGKLAPQKNMEALDRKLESAGRPAKLTIHTFLGLKVFCGLLSAGVTFLLIYLIRSNPSFFILFGISGALGFVGYWLPTYWLLKRISNRQSDILKALPDALDMMVIAVDAGLGLSGAIQRICDNWDNALVDEFNRVLKETQVGRSRIDALESMGVRTGVKEVISFVMALTMAEKTGANIGQVLHIQAEQMRIARRQRAEQLAREAAIKMLFPLVFLIFPAMFAVILGPAVPQLLETLGGF